MALLRRLYATSLEDVFGHIRSRRKEYRPISKEFILSAEYDEFMAKHLPYPGVFDLHEAQNMTQNFRYRHLEVDNLLGVFRWRGMQKHKNLILDTVGGGNMRVVDFGGAACPLGFDSVVMDLLNTDAYGNRVSYKSLRDLREPVDVIFTSHTLEHIEPLEEVVGRVQAALKASGKFIVHVPSFYCERWRAGLHKDRKYHDHVWTFGLGSSAPPRLNLNNYIGIDVLLKNFFSVDLAEYCGDDSILLYCSK